jgi:hypothetical protein
MFNEPEGPIIATSSPDENLPDNDRRIARVELIPSSTKKFMSSNEILTGGQLGK